jgi:hypothetical protein
MTKKAAFLCVERCDSLITRSDLGEESQGSERSVSYYSQHEIVGFFREHEVYGKYSGRCVSTALTLLLSIDFKCVNNAKKT